MLRGAWDRDDANGAGDLMNLAYQRQKSEQSRRTCGAACLSMVYESFGKTVCQEEIWAAIAKENSFGSFASTTHLMVQDAVSRGLSAIAIQARHPLQALRICRESGLRAILNLRLHKQAAAGHYTVLVDVGERDVIVHDPLAGPSRSISQLELLELWQPSLGKTEIAGNALIALEQTEASGGGCQFCGTEIAQQLSCPNCREPVTMRPAAVLGCLREDCAGRMWEYICCPSCDALFDSKGALAPAAPVKDGANATLEHLFSAMDKFTLLIADAPNAANHPDVKTQLAFMAATRERLKTTYAEEVARRTLILGQYAEASRRKNEQEREAGKMLTDMEKPMPRLNGHELGVALLKNLGISV